MRLADDRALAEALKGALRLKGITQKDLAERLGCKPPAVCSWVNRGKIGRANLAAVIEFFADSVGPEHWGKFGGYAPPLVSSLSERERALLDAFRSLPVSRQEEAIESVREARRAKWFPEPAEA